MMWPLFLLSTPTDLYENAVLLMLTWGKNQVNKSTDKSSSSGQTCPLIEKHLELWVVRLNSKANFYQPSNEEKKIFCDFSIQRFQMMSFYLILFHFISKGLSPYHRNWYWSAFETEHVPNNWFNPIVYVRTFERFDLSSIWFDRLLTCSFIWRVNLFTSMWEQQHRKNAHILKIHQKSLYSLTMEWNKTLPTLIKFNSQLDIYVKCTHRVNNRHGTAFALALALAIRHFWCEILSHNDESVHAVQIWKS